MKETIKKLRTELKTLTDAQMGIRRQLQELAWTPGSADAIATLRSQRGEDGRRVNGKRALKPYRRPETGYDRSRLWDQKRDGRYWIRLHLVLLGMLRGLEYVQIERTTAEVLSPRALHSLLQSFGGGAAISEDDIGMWLAGLRPKFERKAA